MFVYVKRKGTTTQNIRENYGAHLSPSKHITLSQIYKYMYFSWEFWNWCYFNLNTINYRNDRQM